MDLDKTKFHSLVGLIAYENSHAWLSEFGQSKVPPSYPFSGLGETNKALIAKKNNECVDIASSMHNEDELNAMHIENIVRT